VVATAVQKLLMGFAHPLHRRRCDLIEVLLGLPLKSRQLGQLVGRDGPCNLPVDEFHPSAVVFVLGNHGLHLVLKDTIPHGRILTYHCALPRIEAGRSLKHVPEPLRCQHALGPFQEPLGVGPVNAASHRRVEWTRLAPELSRQKACFAFLLLGSPRSARMRAVR